MNANKYDIHFKEDLKIINECPDINFNNVEVVDNFVKSTIRYSLPYMYKQTKSGYETFCPNCQEYIKYNEKQFKQIKYSDVCPKCRCNFKLIKKYEKSRIIWSYIRIYNAGYEVDLKFTWKKNPKVIIKQVIKIHHNKYSYDSYYEIRELYIAGMSIFQTVNPCWIYGKIYDSNKKWHKSKSPVYLYYFRDYEKYVPHTKKQVLDAYKNLNLKSNQIKMILDYPFNQNQIYAIKIFNLKSPEEVYKNRVYIRTLREREYEEIPCLDYEFNIQTLEYLKKNKIDFNLYIDYANMCKDINRKLDKPKDFMLWHDRVMEIKNYQKNKAMYNNVIKAGKKLSKNNYKKKDITITAFMSVDEINEVSKTLHNCMSRSYVEPYAKRVCDLYHLDVKGVPTLAIEIKNNKLNQCYADSNTQPPVKLKRIVNAWYKEVIAV